jgi:pyridoxine 4-dehydrogenase
MTSYSLGSVTVSRVGFGAMQLPGPGVFGPPRDRDAMRHLEENLAVSGIELDQQAQDELAAAA